MKVYTDGSKRKTCFKFEGEPPVINDVPTGTTTNEAEYMAVIFALKEAAHRGIKELEVLSDSQLMVRQLNGQYQTYKKPLQDLRRLIMELVAEQFAHVSIMWIPREQNEAGKILETSRKY